MKVGIKLRIFVRFIGLHELYISIKAEVSWLGLNFRIPYMKLEPGIRSNLQKNRIYMYYNSREIENVNMEIGPKFGCFT